MAIRQEVNSPLIITIGAVSATLLVVIFIGLHAWYLYEEDYAVRAKTDAARPIERIHVRTQQQINLNSPPKFIDASQTMVQIPIERAMQLIADKRGMLPTTRPGSTSSAAPIDANPVNAAPIDRAAADATTGSNPQATGTATDNPSTH